MNSSSPVTIHHKEKLYFAIMCSISALAYASLLYLSFSTPGFLVSIYAFYFFMFIAFQILAHAYFIGYIKGNGIKISQHQFPDIYEIFNQQCQELGIEKIPTLWLLQGNGLLNAFATRFSGRNYVVLYSEVFAAAYQEGMPAVKFILGHELGHLKRNHVSFWKSLCILPARCIPGLGAAYSRSCEYTCDNFGYAVCPEGAQKGLLILAAGRELYKKVQISELISNAQAEKGFALWFAEFFSSHPHIFKRLAQFQHFNSSDVNADSLRFSSSKVAEESLGQTPMHAAPKQPPVNH